MPPEELTQAIQRTDTRKSATELIHPKKKPRRYEKLRTFLKKARERFKQLRTGLTGDTKEREKERE